MRISDWSSDVCSSDLMAQRHGRVCDHNGDPQSLVVFGLGKLGGRELNFSSDVDLVFAFAEPGQSSGKRVLDAEAWFARAGQQLIQLLDEVTADGFRSEEHTSELQSLMRISYAVFCLKKKISKKE